MHLNGYSSTPLPPLYIFIHGFLGSSKSFQSFPTDIQHALRTHCSTTSSSHDTNTGVNRLTKVECQHFEYDTHGSNDHRVEELAEYVRTRGAGRPYVVLLGHSMGGILAVDCARRMAKRGEAVLGVAESRVAVQKRSSWSLRKSEQYQQSTTDDNQYTNGQGPVNIRAILAYDSPFFGLHPHVLTHTGTQRIATVTSAVSGLVGKVAAYAGAGGGGVAAATAVSATTTTATGKDGSTIISSTTTSTSAAVPTESTGGSKFKWGLAALAAGAALTHVYRTNEVVRQNVNA
ncbi:hypothetical protein HK102_003913, partial [Quaeritorhiza haematococci]